jgi:T-complex protein 1 subunit delta
MSGEEAVSSTGSSVSIAEHNAKHVLSANRALIAGGGAPEIYVSRKLTQYGQTLKGKEAYCFQAFAEALEIIPTTLAENAGLNPIAIVTELRNRHAKGETKAGINVRKVSPFRSFLLAFAVSDLGFIVGFDLEHLRGECLAATARLHECHRTGSRDRGTNPAYR